MRRNKRRRFARWLGIVFLVLLLVGAAAALFGYIKFRSFEKHYEALAMEYDLAELEQLESASTIFDRNDQEVGRIFLQNREPITLDQVPLEMIQAVVAAEDARFYRHDGVDYHGLLRAAVRNYQAGRIREGGSTITQQLARNTFELRERTYERKLLEMFLARRIEQHYSKSQILEMYLNRIYFGFGHHGIEAAAQGYFGKPTSELTLGEAAMLAGLIRSPNTISPWASHRQAVANRNLVLSRMRELGMLTRAQYQEALDQPLQVRARTSLTGDSYAIEFVRQQVTSLLGYERLMQGGYRIYTTLDKELQETAEESLRQNLDRAEEAEGYDRQTYADYLQVLEEHRRQTADTQASEIPSPPAPTYLQGAVLTIDNHTGGVLVMAGGRDFRHSKFNRTLLGRRPTGTAFKPLVYAAAYQRGFFPGALVEDSPIDNRRVMIGGTTGILGEWGPERVDNRYEGPIPLTEALIQSKNAATVRVGMRTGLERVLNLAREAGLRGPLRPFPATFLGASESSLEEMVLAYSLFPRGGSRPDSLHLVTRVEARDGTVLYEHEPTFREVLPESVAYQVHTSLEETLNRGSASKAFREHGLLRFPAGGKTGTAYNFTDLWFLGYDSEITTGVWMGFDRPATIYRGAFSSDLALPVWVDVMNASLESFPPQPIQRPRNLVEVEVCRDTGLPAGDRCVEIIRATDTGQPEERRTTFHVMALPEQIPESLCQGPGSSIPSFAGGGLMPEESEWPRAQPVVDTSMIRPVAVQMASVVGYSDPYRSVNPGAIDEANIRIVRALPVQVGIDDEYDGDEPLFVEQEMEVRRARPARPLDHTQRETVLELPAPPPIDF